MHTTSIPARRLGFFVVLLGIAIGMTASQPCPAQQPPTPSIPGKNEDVDDRSPLPSPTPAQPSLETKYRIDVDRAIYKGILDRRPVLSEKENRQEYDAWTDMILAVQQFPASDLDKIAARDFTRDDFTNTGLALLRGQLVHFEGSLTSIEKVQPTKSLSATEIKPYYKAWLVPQCQPSSRPICIVVTDLPEGLVPGEQKDKWVSFAGYFFKLMSYPGPAADQPDTPGTKGWLEAPLFVGRTATILPAPPIPPMALNKRLRILKHVEDDAPLTSEINNWQEFAAYNHVFQHAKLFSNEELERASRNDMRFADLFHDVRRDYQFELVTIVGRLIMLRKEPSTAVLKDAGVPEIYQGWIVPHDDRDGHPIEAVFGELPQGLELPTDSKHLMNRWVAFTGYSFKLIRYESMENRADDPKKKQWKKAPLLIGRTIATRAEPNLDGPLSWLGTALWAAVTFLVVLALVGLGLNLWFSKGDRRARREIETIRNRNPFETPNEGS